MFYYIFKFVALRVTMSLEALTTEALVAIAAAQDLVALDQVRVQFTGKKASLQNNRKH